MKNRKINRKGQLSGMNQIFVGLATVAIVTVVLFTILAQLKTQVQDQDGGDFCSTLSGTPYAFNVTSEACYNVTNSSQPELPASLSHAWNSTGTLQQSGQDAVSFVPLLVIAVVGVLLLSLVALFRS